MENFYISYEVDDNKLAQMIELDKKAYFYNDVGNFDLCKNWLSKNSELYTMLMQGDNVLGYINFMPVKESSYKEFITGKLKDYQITSDDILSYENNTNYYALVVSVVLDKNVRKSVCSKLLLNGLKQKLASLNNRGISFKKIACDCVSDEGLTLANKFKFKKVPNAKNLDVFEGKLNFDLK